jgi:hypothetical protein
MNETSLAAYAELQLQRKLQPMEARVVEALQHRPLTREEIAEATGMRLSSVCGRVATLRKSDVIESFGDKRCTITGKRQELLQLVR